MTFPKWKYRKHPTEGFFQQTLVASAEAEAELEADWSDDPESTGFAVRPATQIHHSHFTPGTVLHEVVCDGQGAPVVASIEMTQGADFNG